MCSPSLIAVGGWIAANAGTITTVASVGVAAYGTYQQGQAAKAEGEFQEDVARNNQLISERMAQDALSRGKTAEDLQRRKISRIKGAQRTALAKSGVVIDQDSALDVLGDTAEIGELEALTIRSNAEKEAYGYRTQGMNFATSGRLSRLRGDNMRRASNIRATGSLLTSGGQFASEWSR